MDLHRFWDGVITSRSNLTRLRNEATALRNRQEFRLRFNFFFAIEHLPDKPVNHDGCGGAGGTCTNPDCDKDPESVFSDIHCRVVGKRKPPVRKTELLN
jgi:hypothetical protein